MGVWCAGDPTSKEHDDMFDDSTTTRTTMRILRTMSLLTLPVTAAWLVVSAPAAAQERGGQRGPAAPAAPPMTMTIAGFADGSQIPVKFSQAAPGVAPGEGTSPAISWSNVPAGTQSFVLNMHDMDVVRNKTSDDQAHWVVWNIPATATQLPEGVPKGAKLADGSYQISATGQMYRGPGAPANGPPHHYMFELFALDTRIAVEPTADAFETRANVLKAIQGHILGKAVYGGLFRRPQ
jgi:Raf kinase inhibitor-like YbhB/YbcL family protein